MGIAPSAVTGTGPRPMVGPRVASVASLATEMTELVRNRLFSASSAAIRASSVWVSAESAVGCWVTFRVPKF